MRPQKGKRRKKENSGKTRNTGKIKIEHLGVICRQARKKHCAKVQPLVLESVALLFQPLQKLPRPNELRRHHTETEHDYEPSRTRRDEYHCAQREQGEPEEYLQEPFHLLKRLKRHRTRTFLPTAANKHHAQP